MDIHSRNVSACIISFIKGGLCVRAGVAENLWFKRKTAEEEVVEEEEEANPHMSEPYNNNPAFTQDSAILSK